MSSILSQCYGTTVSRRFVGEVLGFGGRRGDDKEFGDWCEEGEKGSKKRHLVGFTL